MSSNSDTSFDEAENTFVNRNIMPFSFEPEYTEEEIEERRAQRLISIRVPLTDSTAEEPESIEWCNSSHCVFHPEMESICCKNPMILPGEKFQEANCIIETDAFKKVCLDRDVLQTATGSWQDLKGDNINLTNQTNKNYRFIGYKQYIWWSFGYLGKRYRRPLPNCVIMEIQHVFPDPQNVYVPYKSY